MSNGFNLYHAIETIKKNHLKWLNVWAFAASFLRQGEVLANVHFFTALTYGDADKQERHQALMDALAATGVKVTRSEFKKAKKYCRTQDRYCKFWEEKQSDVAIAVSMIADATSAATDRIVLVTADTDQIPAVQFILNAYPNIEMSLAIPPGRKDEARDLGKCFADPREIEEPRIAANLFGPKVMGSAGKSITRPTPYDPPPECRTPIPRQT
jgi:NYN domain